MLTKCIGTCDLVAVTPRVGLCVNRVRHDRFKPCKTRSLCAKCDEPDNLLFFSSDLSGNLITLNFALFTALQLRHFNQFVDLPIVYKSRHVSKQGRIRSEDSCGDPVIDSALLALEKFSKLKKKCPYFGKNIFITVK